MHTQNISKEELTPCTLADLIPNKWFFITLFPHKRLWSHRRLYFFALCAEQPLVSAMSFLEVRQKRSGAREFAQNFWSRVIEVESISDAYQDTVKKIKIIGIKITSGFSNPDQRWGFQICSESYNPHASPNGDYCISTWPDFKKTVGQYSDQNILFSEGNEKVRKKVVTIWNTQLQYASQVINLFVKAKEKEEPLVCWARWVCTFLPECTQMNVTNHTVGVPWPDIGPNWALWTKQSTKSESKLPWQQKRKERIDQQTMSCFEPVHHGTNLHSLNNLLLACSI